MHRECDERGRDLPDAVLTAIAFGAGKVRCGSRDGHLYALDPRKGSVLWKCAVGGPVVASPLVGDRDVAAISVTGKLVIASIETGEELSRFDLSKSIGEEVTILSSPTATRGGIVVGSSNGFVVCLGEKE